MKIGEYYVDRDYKFLVLKVTMYYTSTMYECKVIIVKESRSNLKIDDNVLRFESDSSLELIKTFKLEGKYVILKS